MIKVVLVFIMILFLSEGSKADAGSSLKSTDLIFKKSFNLAGDRGVVHVVVHSKGHLQGMPYVIDLRPACSGAKKAWENLETLDVKSTCAVDVNSFKLSDDGAEISVQVHNPSLESYNKQMKKGIRNVQPECEARSTKHTFSLRDFCS